MLIAVPPDVLLPAATQSRAALHDVARLLGVLERALPLLAAGAARPEITVAAERFEQRWRVELLALAQLISQITQALEQAEYAYRLADRLLDSPGGWSYPRRHPGGWR